MKSGQFSHSAVGAAIQRALHQTLDGASILSDPFARKVLAPEELQRVEASADRPERGFRLFMAARSRLSEDGIADAVSRGVRQVVVLGAGLDTFALRNPHEALIVFEVDHPATQALKIERVERLDGPAGRAVYVAVDFETDNLSAALAKAGFDPAAPAFFMWLGVVPYLSHASIEATLRFIAGLPASEVAFDYSEPLENYAPERRARRQAMAERLAGRGEPWLSHFDPPILRAALRAIGFVSVEDFDLMRLSERYLEGFRAVAASGAGPHVIIARNFPSPNQ